jgi:hypothetical protein
MKACAMLSHFTPGDLNFAPPQPCISFETKIAQLALGDDIGPKIQISIFLICQPFTV